MSIEINGRTGPLGTSQSLGDGSLVDPFLGPQSQVMVQDWAPRYSELARRGLLFNAANQAGSAVTNLAATCTGFAIVNPLGSGKNIWIVDIAFVQTSTAAATANASVVLAANTTPLALTSYTLTTQLTINNALIGGSAGSIAKVCSSITLPAAPVVVRGIWQPSVSATATTAVPPYVKDEVAGAIGISPGCAVSMSAASALSGITSMTWVEVPV